MLFDYTLCCTNSATNEKQAAASMMCLNPEIKSPLVHHVSEFFSLLFSRSLTQKCDWKNRKKRGSSKKIYTRGEKSFAASKKVIWRLDMNQERPAQKKTMARRSLWRVINSRPRPDHHCVLKDRLGGLWTFLQYAFRSACLVDSVSLRLFPPLIFF